MANYNNPTMGFQPTQPLSGGQQQMPAQFPYGNNNMLLNNTPYDNYMGRRIDSQNFLSNQFLKCRPVASKDQARACQIDLDGSLWVFTDIGNGKIYTKQINNDGTATFNTYILTKDENIYNSTDYVTKEQFQKTIEALMINIKAINSQNKQAVPKEELAF